MACHSVSGGAGGSSGSVAIVGGMIVAASAGSVGYWGMTT